MAGPTDIEQLLLEYINDARIDPMGNAARYLTSYSPLTSNIAGVQGAINFFGVNGATLQNQFAGLAPTAPLAWNENLGLAARLHSDAMIAADSQSHQLPGEPDLAARATASGYTGYSIVGENIYAYSTSAIEAHAAFMIDWGAGGIQSPPGHRENIMRTTFREIGVGIKSDNNSGTVVGPLVVTQDFGARFASGAIILGTAYNDNDHDNFYSVGEGLATLLVSVGASSVTSSSSGGFSLLPGVTGDRTVTFSGAGIAGTASASLTLSSTSNVMFKVVNGTTLHTSASVSASGIDTLQGLGVTALTLVGSSTVRALIGSKGGDTITGSNNNNIITGGLGNDTINGGGGTDTAVYSGLRAAFTVTRNSNGTYTVTGADGTDTLSSIEKLQFTDQTMTLAKNPENDFNGDGQADLLMQYSDSRLAVWLTSNLGFSSGGIVGAPGASWQAKDTADFNDDGKADILMQSTDSRIAVWLVDGTGFAGGALIGTPGTAWHAIASADIDGDGKSDILLQADDSRIGVWTVNGLSFQGGAEIGVAPGTAWKVKGSGDFDGDGKSDLVMQSTDSRIAIWLLDGFGLKQGALVGTPGMAWHVKAASDYDSDGKADLVLQRDTGEISLWNMNGVSMLTAAPVGNPGALWQLIAPTGG